MRLRDILRLMIGIEAVTLALFAGNGAVAQITVTKTADSATITAGQTAGFTVTISNAGPSSATGLVLSDPLPAGTGGDINWTIDTTTGNPAEFTITGAKGSQALGFSTLFLAGGDSLAPTQSVRVHITSSTNSGDANGGLGVVGLQNTVIDNVLVSIRGSEGVSEGGSLRNLPPSTITGNVYEYTSGQYSGPGKPGGSVITDSGQLTQIDSNALNAAATAAALTPTQTLGNIRSNTTITGNGNLNVIDINGDIDLHNASLTLTGTASDVFVVNVSGTLSFVAGGGLLLGGEVIASNVLYNLTGSGGTFSSKVNNVFYGTLLGSHISFDAGGSFVGGIIGGGSSIRLVNAQVNAIAVLKNTATVTSTNAVSSSATSMITFE